MGIRAKLIILVFVLVSIVTGVFGGAMLIAERNWVAKEEEWAARSARTEGIALAQTVAGTILQHVNDLKVKQVSEELQIFKQTINWTEVVVTDADMLILTDGTEDNGRMDEELKDPLVEQARQSRDWQASIGASTISVAGPIGISGEDPVGWLLVQFEKDRQMALRQGALRLLSLLALSVLTIGVLGSFLLANHITAPIRNLTAEVVRVGLGDSAARITVHRHGEIGTLSGAINRMVTNLASSNDNLNALADRTSVASTSLLETSTQMAQVVSAQSEGASQQAAAVTQVSATLEQIRAKAGQTLEQANSLKETADLIHMEGERGTQSMVDTTEAMALIQAQMEDIARTVIGLNQQTRQVGEITAAVRALAQQSKMLALNAAIEASKAGESGRGFSVVANEMRHLAEQSEEATRQVGAVLADIGKAVESAVISTEAGSVKVGDGHRQVVASSELVRRLADVIGETSRASRQIADAVKEQTVGIEQVSHSMGDISQVVTRFVSLSQQNQESAEAVRTLARRITGKS